LAFVCVFCSEQPATQPYAQVALVDAFGLPDYLLHSALGRADGDVYAALLGMAQVGGHVVGGYAGSFRS
jgi:hypothetical protein